jgi:hypothetical protein
MRQLSFPFKPSRIVSTVVTMSLPSRNNRKGPRRILFWAAEALVVLYVVFNAILRPVFRPLSRWLASLRLVVSIEARLAQLPPYVILVTLLVPFLSAEPAKVYAVYLMGTGHFASGLAIFIGAYVVSLVLVDHIYHAGKAKLRTLPWFAKVTDYLFAFRDRLIAWVKTTQVWINFSRFEGRIRGVVTRWRLRWSAWLSSLRASKS